jgi:hypothetical protein
MSAATETIAFLRNYNSWRRGDETLEMPSPAEIGATIDDAVNLLRKHDKLERKNAELLAENIKLRERIAFEASMNAQLKEKLENKTNSSN